MKRSYTVAATTNCELVAIPDGDPTRIRVVKDRPITYTYPQRLRWRVWLPLSTGGVWHGYDTWRQASSVAFFQAGARR